MNNIAIEISEIVFGTVGKIEMCLKLKMLFEIKHAELLEKLEKLEKKDKK